MTKTTWIRLAGFGALVALALHGASLLGSQHLDPGLWHSGVSHFQHVLLLRLDLVLAVLPSLALAGWLFESPPPRLVAAWPRLFPSRGPPA